MGCGSLHVVNHGVSTTLRTTFRYIREKGLFTVRKCRVPNWHVRLCSGSWFVDNGCESHGCRCWRWGSSNDSTSPSISLSQGYCDSLRPGPFDTTKYLSRIVFATGMSLGAPLGGLAADMIGWRWSFGMQVPIILFALFVSLRLPSSQAIDGITNQMLKRIDFGGAITLVPLLRAHLMIDSFSYCAHVGLEHGR
jgi:hypothetical protein